VAKVAVELVEAVRRGQEFILVAQVVLAELPGDVTEQLQHFGNGRIFLVQAQVGAG
jgi:hypothetical protein